MIVSPVRNEGAHVVRTIESVVSQKLRPAKWVIVDDGSTDRTGQTVDGAAQRHSWISVIHRPDRGFRKQGGGVIEAFNAGLDLVKEEPWDFICKLDCDLSFAPDYFERLISRFLEDPRLGIASGVYFESSNGQIVEVKMPPYHASGASKVLRRACFEQIRGFVQSRGWDTVDEIRAISKGWRTCHFRELHLQHWKPEGAAAGSWRTAVMHGEIYFATGGGLLFFVFKVLHRAISKPYLFGALALTWGWGSALAVGREKLVTKEEGRIYRSLLNERVFGRLKEIAHLNLF